MMSSWILRYETDSGAVPTGRSTMNDKHSNTRAEDRGRPPFVSTAGSGPSQAPPGERLRVFLDEVFTQVFGDDEFRQRLVQRIQTGNVDRLLLANLLQVLDQRAHGTARAVKESVENP